MSQQCQSFWQQEGNSHTVSHTSQLPQHLWQQCGDSGGTAIYHTHHRIVMVIKYVMAHAGCVMAVTLACHNWSVGTGPGNFQQGTLFK